jgi:hypothetical protein
MAYRAIQRQPQIATRIVGTYATYDEVVEEVEAAGFEIGDYTIEDDCPSCGGWYGIAEVHACNPVVVEPAGWQPYEPEPRPTRMVPRRTTGESRERQPMRRHRTMRWSVVVKEYQARSMVAFGLELGLMVSTKKFSHLPEHTVIRVYGTRRKVHIFEGYVARASY